MCAIMGFSRKTLTQEELLVMVKTASEEGV